VPYGAPYHFLKRISQTLINNPLSRVIFFL
jgi:hypothetical protein